MLRHINMAPKVTRHIQHGGLSNWFWNIEVYLCTEKISRMLWYEWQRMDFPYTHSLHILLCITQKHARAVQCIHVRASTHTQMLWAKAFNRNLRRSHTVLMLITYVTSNIICSTVLRFSLLFFAFGFCPCTMFHSIFHPLCDMFIFKYDLRSIFHLFNASNERMILTSIHRWDHSVCAKKVFALFTLTLIDSRWKPYSCFLMCELQPLWKQRQRRCARRM